MFFTILLVCTICILYTLGFRYYLKSSLFNIYHVCLNNDGENLNDRLYFRYVGTVGEKSQLQGKKMIKDLTKKMFLLESSDGGSSAGWVMTMSTEPKLALTKKFNV